MTGYSKGRDLMKKVIVTVPFDENQKKELCSTGNELDFRFMNAAEDFG